MRVVKEFNLEEALDGKPIMTREEYKCTIIAYIPTFSNGKRLLVQQHNTTSKSKREILSIREYCDNGDYRIDGKSSKYDLIMDIIEELVYVNLYTDGTSEYFKSNEVADYASRHKKRHGNKAYKINVQTNI